MSICEECGRKEKLVFWLFGLKFCECKECKRRIIQIQYPLRWLPKRIYLPLAHLGTWLCWNETVEGDND